VNTKHNIAIKKHSQYTTQEGFRLNTKHSKVIKKHSQQSTEETFTIKHQTNI